MSSLSPKFEEMKTKKQKIAPTTVGQAYQFMVAVYNSCYKDKREIDQLPVYALKLKQKKGAVVPTDGKITFLTAREEAICALYSSIVSAHGTGKSNVGNMLTDMNVIMWNLLDKLSRKTVGETKRKWDEDFDAAVKETYAGVLNEDFLATSYVHGEKFLSTQLLIRLQFKDINDAPTFKFMASLQKMYRPMMMDESVSPLSQQPTGLRYISEADIREADNITDIDLLKQFYNTHLYTSNETSVTGAAMDCSSLLVPPTSTSLPSRSFSSPHITGLQEQCRWDDCKEIGKVHNDYCEACGRQVLIGDQWHCPGERCTVVYDSARRPQSLGCEWCEVLAVVAMEKEQEDSQWRCEGKSCDKDAVITSNQECQTCKSWRCTACTMANKQNLKFCSTCQTKRIESGTLPPSPLPAIAPDSITTETVIPQTSNAATDAAISTTCRQSSTMSPPALGACQDCEQKSTQIAELQHENATKEDANRALKETLQLTEQQLQRAVLDQTTNVEDIADTQTFGRMLAQLNFRFPYQTPCLPKLPARSTIWVMDTNVFMSFGTWSVTGFQGKAPTFLTSIMCDLTPHVHMVIPWVVTKELEKLKQEPKTQQKGLAARRLYLGLIDNKYQDIVHVEPQENFIQNMGAYRDVFDKKGERSFTNLLSMFNDLCIEQLCFQLKYIGHNVVLFTRDILMQLDCKARGIGHVPQTEIQRLFNRVGDVTKEEHTRWLAFMHVRPPQVHFKTFLLNCDKLARQKATADISAHWKKGLEMFESEMQELKSQGNIPSERASCYIRWEQRKIWLEKETAKEIADTQSKKLAKEKKAQSTERHFVDITGHSTTVKLVRPERAYTPL